MATMKTTAPAEAQPIIPVSLLARFLECISTLEVLARSLRDERPEEFQAFRHLAGELHTARRSRTSGAWPRGSIAVSLWDARA